MADKILHLMPTPTKSLVDELRDLQTAVGKLERLALHTDVLLDTIIGHGMLDSATADDQSRQRALDLLYMLHTQVADTLEATVGEFSPSLEVADLVKAAEADALRRD